MAVIPCSVCSPLEHKCQEHSSTTASFSLNPVPGTEEALEEDLLNCVNNAKVKWCSPYLTEQGQMPKEEVRLSGKAGTRMQHPAAHTCCSPGRDNYCCVSPAVPEQGNLAWSTREVERRVLDLFSTPNGICCPLCHHVIRMSSPDTTSIIAKTRSVERLTLPHATPPGPSQRAILVSVGPGVCQWAA